MQSFDITGEPRWNQARESAARLREMPAQQAEANVQSGLLSILQSLFPRLPASELCMEKQTGAGPADVYCRNVIFETKGQGKLDARSKPDGTTETPVEQAERYLNSLTLQSDMFEPHGIGWRAGITDGLEWYFYDYHRGAPDGQRLILTKSLSLKGLGDIDPLLSYLYDFVNRTVKLSPPTYDRNWAEECAKPFIGLAAHPDVAGSPSYEVKRALWRDLLRGAHITPPGESDAERDLFARHTMLVVMARAVAETILPVSGESPDRNRLHDTLTQGFASWLLDAAGDAGEQALDDIISEVNSYDWQSQSRDTLKDLYHAVIPRDIRHDFGEYYTPDWLARAVCEEVMDAKWRQEVIEMAVEGQLRGPAVLDPSCGSGTFLFHATQLLMEDARKRPELANSPQAQVEIVNGLVAGIDLHPVAVELAKATKILSFSDFA